MTSLMTLICLFLFGTIIVVGVGVLIQVRQQRKAKKEMYDDEKV